MDKKIIIAIIIAVLVIGAGAALFMRKSPPPTQPNPTPTSQSNRTMPTVTTPEPTVTQAQPAKTIVVPLATQNNSGQSGTATLMDVNGKTKVTINISGAPADIVQPAHIHTGSCATIGGVKYPLTFPVNGKSETTLDVSIDSLLSQLPLAINIHKSASEASIFVACGDIVNPNTATQNAPVTNSASVEDNNSGAGQFSTPTDNRKGADKPEDN